MNNNEQTSSKQVQINEKSNIDDTNVFPDFYRDLFNNYLEYYNKINKNSNKPLFHGINNNDKSATNKQLEQLYKELYDYTEYKTTNPELIKIIPFEQLNKLNINDDFEIYCIVKDNKPYVVSQSFFAIIKELTDLKNENDKYKYELIMIE